jgi:hypothetical protein
MSLYPILVGLGIEPYPRCKFCGKPNSYVLGFFSPNGCCRRADLSFESKKELIEIIIELEKKVIK